MSDDRPIEIRRAVKADTPAILALLRASLGWEHDERHDALFAWKHEHNPFGPSIAWVACDGTRLAGVRLFLRWEFTRVGALWRAVRAVDTATHPDYQGRGIFTELTLRALQDLDREGVGIVFNTPNEQSLPGYLKMGWQIVGRLPVQVRATSPAALVRMVRARTPAERWSAASTAGIPAAEALADRSTLAKLLASRPADPRIATHMHPDYLRWRYGSQPVEYRALVARGGLEAGLVLFRVRRRGPTRELAIADVITAGDDARVRRQLLHDVARAADADYLIQIERGAVTRSRFVRLPRNGPVLTSRLPSDEGSPPPLAEWGLHLGDVELF